MNKHTFRIQIISLLGALLISMTSSAETKSCSVCDILGHSKDEPTQEIPAGERDEIVDCLDYQLHGSKVPPNERAKSLGLVGKWRYASAGVEGSIPTEKKIPAMFRVFFGTGMAEGLSFREGDGIHEWLMCKALLDDMAVAEEIACLEGGGEESKCKDKD